MSIKDKLPSGVSLVSGQPETANVTISVDGIATARFRSPSSRVERHRAGEYAVRSTSSPSRSRWAARRESQLKKVDVNNLSIGLTYDSVSLGVGRHTVKGVATTVGLPSGVTLVRRISRLVRSPTRMCRMRRSPRIRQTAQTIRTARSPSRPRTVQGRAVAASEPDVNRHPSAV